MNKLTKILFLVLALVLVIGAAAAVTVSADEANLPTITAKNIVYTDMTAIQIAVDPDTVDANDVKLIATWGEDTATYEAYEVGAAAAVAGDYIFTIKGIPASAISDEITFTVVSGDKESAPFTYSVAEYFYERLYSDGIINATEGKDAARKEFYETYLANGAAAQELFRNYDKDDKYVGGTTLVTDYNVIAVKDGVLENGKEVMLSTGEITSTVTANAALAADKTFTGKWTVTTYGETVTTETVANGADVTSNGIVAVTPVYTDATGEYFLAKQAGTVAGKTWDYDVLTSISSDNISYSGSIGSYEIADGALHVEDGATENSQMVLKYWISAPQSYNATVFEFDFKLDQAYSSYPIQIKLANITHTIYYPKIDGSNKLAMQVNGTNTALGTPLASWSTIRFEHYYDEAVLKVFVNNEFVFDIKTTSGTKGQTPMIYLTALERNTASNADLWLDNIYVGHITKTFVAGNPKAAN